MDMADVKPTVVSWFVVGLMAITFIVAAKMFVSRFNIPGLTEIVTAA
jgi:hypothetical protein